MTTAPDTAVDEAVDLSDLDQLDGKSHAYCRRCLPSGHELVVPGERFPALCGAEAYSWAGDIGDASAPPRQVCPACLEVLWSQCPRCGNLPERSGS